MVDFQPPPFRSFDDFFLCSARFSAPDVRNLERWNNRIINNLLYYQSNYFAFVVAFLVIVGYFQPFHLILGATVVFLLFLGFVWAAENKSAVRRFRRNHPSLCLAAILGSSYLLLSVLGGVAVFLFGIAFPILVENHDVLLSELVNVNSVTVKLCHQVVLIHASVRLRSLKNKLENKLESIGLKRTPMGLLLEALGQEQEAGS